MRGRFLNFMMWKRQKICKTREYLILLEEVLSFYNLNPSVFPNLMLPLKHMVRVVLLYLVCFEELKERTESSVGLAQSEAALASVYVPPQNFGKF